MFHLGPPPPSGDQSQHVRRFPPLALLPLVALSLSCSQASSANVESAPASLAADFDPGTVVDTYCVVCHNQALNTSGLALDQYDALHPQQDPEVWERVIKKLRTGTMPPIGMPRPDSVTYERLASWFESALDSHWAAAPEPGRISAFHRLNRFEYNNAIRDLFALDVDVTDQLPGDETADGSFDNFADVLSMTTAHLERYMSVARQVSRLAVGIPPTAPEVQTFEIPLHIVQKDLRSTQLPLGSRGGMAVQYVFPADGEYEIRIRLRRQYQDYLMGMGWPQELELRLDGELVESFSVGGGALDYEPAAASYAGSGEPGSFGAPEWEEYMQITGDAHLVVRIPVEAGPHVVGVSFPRQMWEPEGIPQPLQRGRVLTDDQLYMDHASVHSVQIGGPYRITGTADDTPSRRAIFTCTPSTAEDEEPCAARILGNLAHRAYRRPVGDEDVNTLMEFYRQGKQESGDFDTGIQFALERLLVDPEFLFRIYREPSDLEPGSHLYSLSDLEVASRLSFFLWSSIPDERLLELAERGELTDPAVLEKETLRMLADPKAAHGLINGFVAQWLNLRLLEEAQADPDIYPDFDDNLIEAFRKETELFVWSTIEEDRSILDLLSADYTYINARLARHYGISGVYGSRYRRVTLPNLHQRGGLLGHAGLLAATSYPNRTSPVLRGKWLLDNILGAPVKPPPANIDTSLDQDPVAMNTSIRERLARHRNDPLCSTCHTMMDPLGFALESFDATGAWRATDDLGKPVDNIGTWPTGRELNGFEGLRAMLIDEGDQFVTNVTSKLMSYAYGRDLDYYDQPSVRQIVRKAEANDYRWSSVIVGIVNSPGFLKRATQTTD